ncbi:MAG: hypothetical protein AAF654_10905 [Myxococcota bacterium]
MIRARGDYDEVYSYCGMRYDRAVRDGASRTQALVMTLDDAQIRYRPSIEVRRALRHFEEDVRKIWAANPEEVSA